VDYVKPEQVKAFELGYRSFIEGFSVDVNGITIYTMTSLGILMWLLLYMVPLKTPSGIPSADPDFSLFILANSNFRAFQLYTNTKVEIKSLGFGLGLSRKVYKDFEVGVNYNYAEFKFDQAKDPSFAGFNTKHRVKASFEMKII
jgi:hypothetical protein